MSVVNVAMLAVYSLGLSFGQVLFKLAAEHSRPDGGAGTFILSLLTSWYFYLAVAVYGLLTVLWIWILTRVPLSSAYPFVGLAFVFTPALGVLIFRESVDIGYLASLAMIVGGLGLLATRGT